MTYSSNSKARIERLAMLVEEAAEMSRAAMRVLRFGGASKPTLSETDNREALSRKVGNILDLLEEMRSADDFTDTGIAFGATKRRQHKAAYTTHQPYSRDHREQAG